MSLEEITKSGASARRSGTSLLKNPFYERDSMPSATGESMTTWSLKAQAWTNGWRAADDRQVHVSQGLALPICASKNSAVHPDR
ncbi:CrpP-related protein [Variovorax sp. RB2P76]|uniref:CrpP-related protein n=1 Tax=Variovorax sp. RB2P76 TaxID=3443736 RepID=UPI003F45A6E9